MTQYTTQANTFLNNNRHIYDVIYLANNANGDIVSSRNPLPVTLGSENITITGNTFIVDTVNVASSPENPVHTHITEVGTSGLLNVAFLPVGGNINVTNVVAVSQNGTWNVNVFGNVTANGTVNIGNFPATQTVNGSVYLSNGTIAVTQSGSWNINISNTVAVSGTINIGNTVQVNVINFPATQNVQLVGASANTPPLVSFADTVQIDTTERLRTSVQGQQWWYVPSVDKDGDLRVQEKIQGANGANSVFIQNLASVRLSSGQYYSSNTQLTGTVVRASRRRHKTRPGVSQEWIGIVNLDGLQTNVTKRIGLFTNYNGVFFEATGTTVNAVVRRRLTDGTLVEDKTPYTSWNKDSMNGTGASGYNWSNTQNIIANVTSVYTTTNVSISGDGTVYQVTYQMPAGEETKIPVGKKVTLTGLTPTG